MLHLLLKSALTRGLQSSGMGSAVFFHCFEYSRRRLPTKLTVRGGHRMRERVFSLSVDSISKSHGAHDWCNDCSLCPGARIEKLDPQYCSSSVAERFCFKEHLDRQRRSTFVLLNAQYFSNQLLRSLALVVLSPRCSNPFPRLSMKSSLKQ